MRVGSEASPIPRCLAHVPGIANEISEERDKKVRLLPMAPTYAMDAERHGSGLLIPTFPTALKTVKNLSRPSSMFVR